MEAVMHKHPSSTSTIETLLSHSSCRSFFDEPITEEIRDLLFTAAQSAPTKSNLQQYSFIEITDSNIRDQLISFFPEMKWAINAPLLFIVLGDLHRNQTICEWANRTYNAHHQDAFLNASVDAALATQSLIMAAESIGLGACAISKIREKIEQVSDLLELPKSVFPICALAIGYPKLRPGSTSPRLPLDAIRHINKYRKPSRELIKHYDAQFNASYGPPTPRYPEQFGSPKTASWSDNVSRQTSVCERNQLTAYLVRQGIIEKSKDEPAE
jgi:nitroreductase